MRRLVILAALAACKSGESPPKAQDRVVTPAIKAPPTLEAPSEMAPALMPLAWLRGDWVQGAASVHWNAAGGALYGVRFDGQGAFEAWIIDDVPDLRLFALGAGDPPREAALVKQQGRTVAFADTPVIAVDDGNRQLFVAASAYNVAASPSRAPELEAADRAFSADTGARGVAGWLAAFEPAGSMISRGKKVSGAAVGESMKPLLDSGTLSWAPIASAINGTLGFTVGVATFMGKTVADNWKSSYITIWAKQPDGSWKVRFDTGRPI